MVKTKLTNNRPVDELQQIMTHIKNGDNFLLSGGAGSGKTYTLVQVIKQIIKENPNTKIACMTYTNAAVKEIDERVNNKNLSVSTIHDFLWDNIKHFQKELKSSLIDLANDEGVKRIKITGTDPIPNDFFNNLEDGIQYKEYLRLKDGIISHDELLIVANYMFKSHPKLSDILKDKFKFIFVDEYQDTQKAVVEILLDHLKRSKKKNIVGFFGDAMQSIYDDGIGNLDDYKGNEQEKVKEIKKEQNRRNPQSVIDLANKLRTDEITQKPSDDKDAPNMDSNGEVKNGSVKFIYSTSKTLEDVKKYLDWDFDNSKETKELNLTHNLIAGKAGFRNLMDIYDKDKILDYRNRIKKYIKDNNIEYDFSEKTFGEVIEFLQNGKIGKELNKVKPTKGMQEFIDENTGLFKETKSYKFHDLLKIYLDKDQLLDDKKQDVDDEKKKGSKRDNLIKHLFKIQNNISLYKNRQFNEFIRITEYRVDTIEKKRQLKKIIENLVDVEDKTIEDVIKIADEKGICKIDDRLKIFQIEKAYIYNRVKVIKFNEFQKLYAYLEGYTPFSTQHKTKGTEFNNVLMVLDNANWNKYNFENLFLENGKDSVLNRSQKIFYVCCTRTKENLAVYYNNPNNNVINKAKEWFGESNVVDLDGR
jgi:DNA helicase-2/ATP-dependent DNA helicase PcrA